MHECQAASNIEGVQCFKEPTQKREYEKEDKSNGKLSHYLTDLLVDAHLKTKVMREKGRYTQPDTARRDSE